MKNALGKNHKPKFPTRSSSKDTYCFIDGISNGIIYGWIINFFNYDAIIQTISVFIDGNFVRTVDCKRFRCDIFLQGFGDGHYAFEIHVPKSFMDGRSHLVTLISCDSSKRSLYSQKHVFSHDYHSPNIDAYQLADYETPTLKTFLTQFNKEFYEKQSYLRFKNEEDALKHYFTNGLENLLNPHPLFDAKFYCKQIPGIFEKKVNPLVHYNYFGCIERKSFSPFFNIDFYERKCFEFFGKIERNLLYHYLTCGFQEELSPCSLFFPKYYLSNNSITTEIADPLSHYIVEGSKKSFAFNPYILSEKTKANYSDDENTLLFLLQSDLKDIEIFLKKHLIPFFDEEAYLLENEDLLQNHIEPFTHFFMFGLCEEHRKINYLESKKYILNSYSDYIFRESQILETYLTRRSCLKALVFIGHDASRTGAPLILLKIIQKYFDSGNYDIYLILKKSGELYSEYCKYSHVIVSDGTSSEKISDYVLKRISDNPPIAIIANSIESRDLAKIFAFKGYPLYFLIHEMPEFYPINVLDETTRYPCKIIFPSKYIYESYKRIIPKVADISVIYSQGLLNESFGSMEVADARDFFRRELNIPDDIMIVLGCGTVDNRKGADLFVEVASNVFKSNKLMCNAIFVWVGAILSTEYDTIKFWIDQKIKKFGLEEKVRFVGHKYNTEPYFLGADLFLLTSRADPFPCVVHEAMAASLPIIVFEQSGGAPEAIENAGIIVPYEDTVTMSESVMRLLNSKEIMKSMGKAAKNKVINNYSFSEYAQKLINMTDPLANLSLNKNLKLQRLKEKKKIIFFASDWGISGVNSITENLVLELLKYDFDAEILFTKGRYSGLSNKTLPKTPFHMLQPNSDSPEAIWHSLSEYLNQFNSCICIPNYDYIASAITSDLSNKIGVVGVVHADDNEHYEHVYRLGNYWNRIISVSEEIQQNVNILNASFAKKNILVKTGVAVKHHKNLNINKDQPINLAYIGRLDERQKNISHYIKLAIKLYNKRINFKLTFVGDGEKRSHIEQSLHDLIDQNIVKITGHISNDCVKDLLENTHVILLLSAFEGLPMSLLEGMERGCVPIVYNIDSGINNLIKNGANGYRVKSRSIDEICTRIETLLQSPLLFRKLSEGARNTIIKENYTLEKMGQNYAYILDEVFLEITSRTYKRQRALTYNSPAGNIVFPSSICRLT